MKTHVQLLEEYLKEHKITNFNILTACSLDKGTCPAVEELAQETLIELKKIEDTTTYMNIDTLRSSPLGKDRLDNPKENWRVVTAANKNIHTNMIVAGVRHFDKLMRAQIFAANGNDPILCINEDDWDKLDWPKDWTSCDQGFVDNYQTFLSRREAWYIADAAGQIINQDKYGREGYLYSENIH